MRYQYVVKGLPLVLY